MPRFPAITSRITQAVIVGCLALAPIGAQSDTLRATAATWAADPAPGSDTARMYFERNGARQLGIVYVESISRTPTGFLIVQQNLRPNGAVVGLDSIAIAEKTLAPQWHSDVTRRGRMRVVHENGRLRGTSIDSAGAVTPVDVAVAPDLIDFSVVASFIRLLPLRLGYAAVLESYDIRRGVMHTPVRVVSEETLTVGDANVPTWKVESVSSNGQVATHWIDRNSRRELRVRISGKQGDITVERSIGVGKER